MPFAALRWPGPDDNTTVEFPGPDNQPAPRWPAPDNRAVPFPPMPRFAVSIVAQALGAGSASAFVVAVPWRSVSALGGGVAAVSATISTSITAPALGGGVARAAIVNAEIDARAVGDGVAAVSVVPRATTAAGAVGGGAAGMVGVPVAAVTAAAVGMGAGTTTAVAGALVAAAATGGGIADSPTGIAAKFVAGAVGDGVAGATIVAAVHYSDTFNRADNASLGADWRVDRNASPQVSTNRAQMKTMDNADGRAGCWASYQGTARLGRLTSDSYGVKIQLIAPTGNLATDNFTGAVLAVGDTFGAGTMAYFVASTGNGCAIYTQTASPPTSGISTGQTGQTQRAVTATNAAVADLFDFRRVRNTDGTAWVFNLYRNSNYTTPFLSWVDTADAVSSGAAFRRWGILCEGNYPFFNAEYRSPAIDAVVDAYDL